VKYGGEQRRDRARGQLEASVGLRYEYCSSDSTKMAE